MFGLISSPGLIGNVDSNWMDYNLPKMYQKVSWDHLLLSQLHVLALACSCETLYTLHASGKHHLALYQVLNEDLWGWCARGTDGACCSETSPRPAAGKVGSLHLALPPPHSSQLKQNQNRGDQKWHGQVFPLVWEAHQIWRALKAPECHGAACQGWAHPSSFQKTRLQ